MKHHLKKKIDWFLSQGSGSSGGAAPTQPTISGNNPVELGDTLTISNYDAGLSYQWYKDGIPIGGETGQTLVVTGFEPDPDKDITVVATNGFGSTESEAVPIWTPKLLSSYVAGYDAQQNRKFTWGFSGRTIAQIDDVSGNGINAISNGTSAFTAQPQYGKFGKLARISNSGDNTNYLRMNGSINSFLDNTQGELICRGARYQADTSAHFFNLAKVTDDNGYFVISLNASGATNGANMLTVRSKYAAGSNDMVGVTLNNTTPNLFSVSSNGSRYKITIADSNGDPVNQTLSTILGSNSGRWCSSISSPTILHIGSNISSVTNRGGRTDMYEWYYFNTELSDSDRAKVMNYIHHHGVASKPFSSVNLNIWASGCPHVGSDKALGRNSLTIPASQFSAAGVTVDLALMAGDFGHKQGPMETPTDDSAGAEVASQLSTVCSTLGIQRADIISCGGNHDPGAGNYNWWNKYVDPGGLNTASSGVNLSNLSSTIKGYTHSRTFLDASNPHKGYYDRIGNLIIFSLPDRNDLPYPVGFDGSVSSGGHPSGALTQETIDWWKSVITANKSNRMFMTVLHANPRYTTIATPDGDGLSSGLHGTDSSLDDAGSGSTYSIYNTNNSTNEPATTQIRDFLRDTANHNHIMFIAAHTHYDVDQSYQTRENLWTLYDTRFLNCSNLTKHHESHDVKSQILQISGRYLKAKMYMHDDVNTVTPEGFVANQEFIIEMPKTL